MDLACKQVLDIIQVQKENTIQGHQYVYFGKGIGLVEWQSSNKKLHFRLEQILSQEEWLKIISR